MLEARRFVLLARTATERYDNWNAFFKKVETIPSFLFSLFSFLSWNNDVDSGRRKEFIAESQRKHYREDVACILERKHLLSFRLSSPIDGRPTQRLLHVSNRWGRDSTLVYLRFGHVGQSILIRSSMLLDTLFQFIFIRFWKDLFCTLFIAISRIYNPVKIEKLIYNTLFFSIGNFPRDLCNKVLVI